jgi:dimethylhistidine N-methyltransferase
VNEESNPFLREALEGFARPQKTLSPKWLYDRRGSELFEEITGAPEYYPTRTEAEIFQTAFPALGKRLEPGGVVIEYGSGSSRKTGPLLSAVRPRQYVPIDISGAFLRASAADIDEAYRNVEVVPVVADFTRPVDLPDTVLREPWRMGFFPGSTIGNLSDDEASGFLTMARRTLGAGAYMLLGADLIKDRDVLEAAYDDAGGITAAFNLNLLERMNRELDADFDVSRFRHRAIYNEARTRVEMHVVSLADQTVHIAGQAFEFPEGETIHTENSRKFTVDSVFELGRASGWEAAEVWTDPKDWFGVFLLRSGD